MGHSASAILWVPRSTIPAYSRVEERDVTSKKFALDKVPKDALMEKGSLVGHFALQTLAQDKPVKLSDLGAEATSGTLLGKQILGLELTYSQSLSGQLRSGDLISLMGSDRRKNAVAVLNVLVVDCRKQPSGDDFSVVLAVDERMAKRLSVMPLNAFGCHKDQGVLSLKSG